MTRTGTRAKRALVLSGGGVAGGAWMLGMIHALREGGIDLIDADLIVGTSAGARVGAAIAGGALDQVVRVHRSGPREADVVQPPATLDQFVDAARRIMAETPDRREAARRIANLKPLGSRLISASERDRALAHVLPVASWPDRLLVIAAVDAETGTRVAFDRRSSVPLRTAVAASGALPGVVELPEIDGRRYADGGVHSLYNADLAAGHDCVIVMTPRAMDPRLQQLLDTELAQLGDVTTHVIVADSRSLKAIGPNPISASTAAAALEAGGSQAEGELSALTSVWRHTDSRSSGRRL